MTPNLADYAAMLGIRLPGSKPETKKAAPPRAARRPGESRSGRDLSSTCRRGHEYGPHTKQMKAKNGKVYTVRYCRTCQTDYERQRRAKKKAMADGVS